MNRDNKTYIILFSITLFLMSLSLLQPIGEQIVKPLNGVEEKQSMPKLTFKSYMTFSFQMQLEKYIEQSLWLRGPLIRSYNQFFWDLYHITTQKGIELGEGDWLYERWFVDEYYESRMYRYTDSKEEMQKIFDQQAKYLYQLSKILEQYDTKLFVSILPGKEQVYPEYIPIRTSHKEKGVVARDYYKKLFDESGLPYIDLGQWFVEMKDTASFLLFPQTGTHWSNLAAAYSADTLIKYMEALGAVNMNNISIGPHHKDKPRGYDNDLEKIMNLIHPICTELPSYAEVTVEKDSTAVKPSLITIGDSFYWNIINQVPLKKIFSHNPYWYYNSTIYYDDEYNNTCQLNIVEQVLNADFIMLSFCSAQIYELSKGFAERALIGLCVDPSVVEEKRVELTTSIKESAKRMEEIKRNAKEKGMSVDEIIANDVECLLSDPQKYEELRVDGIPTTRSYVVDSLLKVSVISDVTKIINCIKKDTGWYSKEVQKAQLRGVSVDSMLQIDARWIIRNRK